MARSAFSVPIYIGEQAFWVRAIPCSNCGEQRHKIIRNRVALAGEESVSVGHQRHPPPVDQETHPCASTSSELTGSRSAARRQPQSVRARSPSLSKEELHAARLGGKRLLALWNALPGVEKRRKV